MLAEQILDILRDGNSFDYCDISEITYSSKKGYEIRFGREYDTPTINFSHLMKLSKLFGTELIDLNNYCDGTGCETCGWGSNYGQEIQIYEPTLNVEELKGLVGKDLVGGA